MVGAIKIGVDQLIVYADMILNNSVRPTKRGITDIKNECFGKGRKYYGKV